MRLLASALDRVRITRASVASVLAVGVIGGLGAGGAGAAVAGVDPATPPPRAELTTPICQTALDPPARAVSVTAVMRPLLKTEKLAVEFELLERAAGATAWSTVSGAGLGTWLSPTSPPTLGQRPGDVWYVQKPVADLDAPANYRFEVTFRWSGAAGKVLGTRTLLGQVCHQPELRPDLTVNSISVAQDPLRPARDNYTVVIGNLGVNGAGPFDVQLTDGPQQVERRVAHIAPHATLTLTFSGQPACDPAQSPSVTVDPQDLIDVYSRSQATLTAQCPTPPSTAGGA